MAEDEPEDPRIFLQVERDLLTPQEKAAENGFWLDQDQYGYYADDGPICRAYSIGYVEQVFRNPAVIFGGLRRKNYDDACGYAAHASVAMDHAGAEFKTAVPFVLMCFGRLFEERKEFIFFDWEYRLQDPRESGWPANWLTDFGDPIWNRPPSAPQARRPKRKK